MRTDPFSSSSPRQGSRFGNQELRMRFLPTELRESLVTAVRVPRSHHLQKGDVRVDQCELHSPESRDGVASRTSL